MKKTPLISAGRASAFLGALLMALAFAGCDNPAGSDDESNRVETPWANPQAGAVGAGTKVALATATGEAEIYYTVDGSAPTRESAAYTGAIIIDKALTIKAIAVKEGMDDSAVLEAKYAIDQTIAAVPVASPAPGVVARNTAVTLSTATPNAEIYYTTDGTAPTHDSAAYTGAIIIDRALTIKAIAAKEGLRDSALLEADYALLAAAAAPTASPPSGAVAKTTAITLSAEEGAAIYYTADGSEPTINSAEYTDPIAISQDTTIKAVAVKAGQDISDVLEASYTIIKAAAPTASPETGAAVALNSSVTLSTATEGAEIYYTVNGTAPNRTKIKYANPITISGALTIKAIAVKDDLADSDVLTAAYTIDPSLPTKAATPAASPDPGAVSRATPITLATATEGAKIYYTLDGTEPDATKTEYTGPITIPAATTIRAIAVKEGLADSDRLAAAYAIAKAAAPAADPAAGEIAKGAITLGTATEGAEIYYTLDGTAPDTTKTKYTAPISITAGVTIRAIAAHTDLDDSAVFEAAYTIAKAAAPAADPPAGQVPRDSTVKLSTATEGAEIYYTLDGTAPDTTKTKYTAPISITAGVTIRAIAAKADLDDSAVFEAAYTVPRAAKPAADPEAGAVPYNSKVSLSTATADAAIYYTTDGTAPGSTKTKYTEPISITAGVTIKAVTVKAGMTDSDVFEAAYTILPAATPVASPPAGSVVSGSTVTLSAEADAAIYYTLDGTEPDSTKTKYTDPISITAATTIKAIAIKTGSPNSEVLTAAYALKAAAPTVDVPAGLVALNTQVSLSAAGAAIYYTLDGSAPDDTKTLYTGPITIDRHSTIKAIAVKDSLKSDVLTLRYTVPQAAAPVATPAAGGVTPGTTVALSTTTAGATIYYTTDGSEPTQSSTAYASAITITQDLTIKAIAVAGTDMLNSEVMEAAYILLVPTTEVQLGYTAANSSDLSIDSPASEGAPYPMAATEKGLVYFGIFKKAEQTLALGGTDGARVSVYTDGTELDGDTSSDTWAVAAVKTGILPFEGGTLNFDLTVSEPGALPRTLSVALTIGTTKTGGAVFKVTRPEGQTYADGDDEAILERLDPNVDTFERAVIWVETYAQAGTEYLVRVENDDTSLKKYRLGFNKAENVTMRLKGSKKEGDGETWSRILKHDGTGTDSVNISGFTVDFNGVFQIGGAHYEEIFPKRTFILDSNITLEGNGSSQSSRYRVLIWVGRNATFVLRPGAVITKHYRTTLSSGTACIFVTDGQSEGGVGSAGIRLEGGSITNCTINNIPGASGGGSTGSLIAFSRYESFYEVGAFYKAASVVVSGNVNANGGSANEVVFGCGYALAPPYRAVYDLSAAVEVSLPVAPAE